MPGSEHMGKKPKKNMKQKLCEFTYRKRGLCKKMSCIQKSMDEVCRILNPKC